MAKATAWSVSLRVAFAGAALARGLCWCLADMLLGYHLYRLAGLTSGQTALILMLLLLMGAAADLGAGVVLKQYQSRRPAVLAMQRMGAMVAAVALVALFVPTIGFTSGLVWGGIFRVAFAFYAIPQTTLLSLLPQDDREQHVYVTLHSALGAMARLLTAGGAFLMVGNVTPTFPNVQIGWSIGLAGFAVLTAFLLEQAAGRGDEPHHAAERHGMAVNRWPPGFSWCLLVLASHACALFMASRLFLFTPAPVGGAAVGTWLLLAWAIGMAIGPWTALCRTRMVLPVAVMLTAGATLLLVSAVSATVSLVAASLYGIGLSASGAALLNAITRQVRYQAGSADGLAFAIVALVTKFAMAAGNGALAFLLDGYAAGEASASRMLILITLAGAAICLLAWWRANRMTRFAPRFD